MASAQEGRETISWVGWEKALPIVRPGLGITSPLRGSQ